MSAPKMIKQLLQSNIIHHSPYPSNLYQLLSLLPGDGLNARVLPEKWLKYDGKSYYTITNVVLSPVAQYHTQQLISAYRD
jgi:hypothetical protein